MTYTSTIIELKSKAQFRNQDKVMLLGHEDGYIWDRNMKAIVAFNHFGPNCNQGMPRVSHGFACIVNNLYQGWSQYSIGGRMSPSIKSVMPPCLSLQSQEIRRSSFRQTGLGGAKLPYNNQQRFQVADARSTQSLTSSSSILGCSKTSRC